MYACIKHLHTTVLLVDLGRRACVLKIKTVCVIDTVPCKSSNHYNRVLLRRLRVLVESGCDRDWLRLLQSGKYILARADASLDVKNDVESILTCNRYCR